jgi:hypothetical protein
MSERYAYIPTVKVVEALLAANFQIYEVAQTRPYKAENDPYVKHLLRFRYPMRKKEVGALVPELVLVNAHNGTAKYHLYAGLWRLICANGLMTGQTIASMVVAHRGADITTSNVLEGSYKIVHDEFPKVLTEQQAMSSTVLTLKKQRAFAEQALALRYQGTVPTIKPAELLNTRRAEDDGPSVWQVFNRIQENIMRGGWQTQAVGIMGRLTTVRPVERVDGLVRINRGLWDIAVGYTL